MSSRPRENLVTAEQLYELPDDGIRHELLRGTLVSEPLQGGLHGRTVSRITKLLTNFVDPRRLGVVYTGDTGFVLARQPDTVRGPDVASRTSCGTLRAPGCRPTPRALRSLPARGPHVRGAAPRRRPRPESESGSVSGTGPAGSRRHAPGRCGERLKHGPSCGDAAPAAQSGI